MSSTLAMPYTLLNPEDRPLCPGCIGGRLGVFKITISLDHDIQTVEKGWQGAVDLTGWLAKCVGAKRQDGYEVAQDLEECGFTMPMEPRSAEKRRKQLETGIRRREYS